MELFFEIAGDQIDGARDYQEDAFLTTYIDDEAGESKGSALVIMADGMGGHAAGNIASNLVVSTFNKTFTGKFGVESVADTLHDSLVKANDALRESIRETPALDGMGCTMVTAAFTKGKVYWVSVGDSHLYVIRDRELLKKNEDHSYGGYLDRMKAQGIDVEAEAGLSRNMLMSAMTGEEIAEIDCPDTGFQLLPGDRVVIASDGLDTLSPGTIIQTSAWSQSAKDCVQALLAAVDETKKPRQDNTTVIVVDVLARESAERTPAPAEPTPVEVAPEPGDTQPIEALRVAEALEATKETVAPVATGGKKGLLVGAGVGVVALLAIGAGVYLWMGAAPPAPPPVAREPTVEPAPVATPETPEPPATAPQPAPPPVVATRPEPATSAAPGPGAAPTTPPATATAPPAAPVAPREFRDTLSVGGQGPVMVEIPAGAFQMGSGSLSVEADERPQHEVRVEAFAMSKYEITFAEYRVFARATGRSAPDNMNLDEETHPVVFVSWDDAYNYAQWLSAQTGKRYRLPSEAEWEYAAAAGTDTTYWWGYDVGENKAHCFDCKTGLDLRKLTRVGRFEPNPFGLHDTAGNVSEWVHDCYHSSYQGAPSDGRVWEGGDCSSRVARGGAYTSTSKSIRPSKREKFPSQGAYDWMGFRVARDL